jgi:PKHD-type hydroxylase
MTNENLDLSSDNSNFTDMSGLASPKMASLDIISINKSELFSKEDCEKILNACIEELWLPATVIGKVELHSSRRQKLRGDIEGFPFQNIRDVTKTANVEIYDFNLLGIIDQDYPQVFKYSEKDFYNLHIELTPLAPSRKISFIINLSDPSTYEGGKIEFLNVDTSQANISEQGCCLTFPSYMPYRITPVTKGVNHVIIGHVHGALFR